MCLICVPCKKLYGYVIICNLNICLGKLGIQFPWLLKVSLAALVEILINLREIYTRISLTNS